MRPWLKFHRWFWRGAHPARLWRYFAGGERKGEHAQLRSFRLRFAPFALSQAMLGVPWAGAALIAPSSAKAILLWLGAGKIVGGGALAGALVHLFFPVRVDEREVRGRTFIGLSRRVRWSEVERVQKRQWGFTSFLLISSRGEKTTLWLPLFLGEQREFERLVEGWLAPDHPVRVFFAGERKAKTPTSTNSCKAS